ncbi:MAG: LPS assembly lipoprotein LptE [Pseudomonadota bacterium]
MSSDRVTRRTTLLSLTALAGCGFAPIYGDGGNLRGQFQFDTDDTVAGFQMRAQLEDRLGAPEQPNYVLATRLRTSTRAAAIDPDGDTTRLNIVGTAAWQVTDGTGAVLGSGEVDAFTSYATTASTIATQSSRDDAEARLASILADMVVARVLLLAQDWPA